MSKLLLETKNIKKKFGDQEVLQDISMSIAEGDIYGFLGKNGAGKSTTMKIILGLMKADEGEINIFGKNLFSNRKYILSNIGALIEEP